MRRRNWTIPYVLFLAIFVVIPLLLIVYYAFTNDEGMFTFANFRKFMIHPEAINTFVYSVGIALITTILCLLLGYPAAWILSQARFNTSRTMVVLFILPMWVNILILLVPVVCQLRDLSRFDDGRAGAYHVLYAVCGAKRHAPLEADEPEYLRGGVGFGGDSVSGLAEGDLPGNPSGYDQWLYPCLHAVYRRFRRDHIYDW